MSNTRKPLDDKIIDFEFRPPLESWTVGASIVPKGAEERVDRLLVYQDWYHGRFSPYIERESDRLVVNNLFRRIAVFLADFLMARAPVIEHGIEAPVSARFVESLMEAMYSVMLDYQRFGVGLMQVSEGAMGWQVDSPQPTYWFPIDDTVQVLLDFVSEGGVAYVDVLYDFGAGGMIEERYTIESDKLSALADNPTEVMYGTPEDWDTLARSSYGRLGTTVSTARRPRTGDWGLSAFEDIASLIFENTRGNSQISRILSQFANPKYKPVRRAGNAGMPGGIQRANLQPGNQPTSAGKIEITRWFDRDLDQDAYVIEPPPGYDDIEYLLFTGSLRDHQMQRQLTNEDIFLQSSIPAALWGLGTDGPTPSGVALSRQYVPTSVYIQDAQESLIKEIRKVLLIGALVEGLSGAALEDYANSIRITWDNMFDESTLVMEGMTVTREDSAQPAPIVEDIEPVGEVDDEGELVEGGAAEAGPIEVLP